MTANLLADAVANAPSGETTAFWTLAAVAGIGAIAVVATPKAVYSAMFLASTMLALAALYVVQGAVFLGVVQVVVYTGAVMMLFLFVLMLIGVDSTESLVETIRGQRIAAVLAVIGLGFLLTVAIGGVAAAPVLGRAAGPAPSDDVQGLAALVFTRYLWAFEITSALLLTAALGAMVFAHRHRSTRRQTQRELSIQRFRPGGHPTTLPNPGVFAHHNAVNIVALLPDGAPAFQSVSAVLQPHRVDLPSENNVVSAGPALRLVVDSTPHPGTSWVEDWTNGRKEEVRNEP